MTCNYDNDHFNQGLKFQHSRENGHGHSQKIMQFNFEHLLKKISNRRFD